MTEKVFECVSAREKEYLDFLKGMVELDSYTPDKADVDAVGACIGTKGMRIAEIVEELRGEKIDVVLFSEKPEEYIAAALSPAKIREVEFDGERSAKIWVDSDQLSLAIGKEGQNARLAAKLTGYKIDIKGRK